MHDFGASHAHTIILDLPLIMNPMNLLKPAGDPMVHFDRQLPSRFGVLPRYQPDCLRWFETSPSLIFHTVNTWDSTLESTYQDLQLLSPTQDTLNHTSDQVYVAVNMLACRFRTAKLIYTAGGLSPPPSESLHPQDIVRLTYYRFSLSPSDPLWSGPSAYNEPAHLFALSAIPFEFPVTPPQLAMSELRWVYGCSMTSGSFEDGLRGGARPNVLVKIDVRELIKRGLERRSEDEERDGDGIFEVDPRSMPQLLTSPPDPAIRLLVLPEGFYLQEPSFVPRKGAEAEDQGWLLSYVFDESQLDEEGHPTPHARSELWVMDAELIGEGRNWEAVVVCRIRLPARVPYGLHSTFINADQIQNQRSGPINAKLDQKKSRTRIRKIMAWWLTGWSIWLLPVLGLRIGLEDLKL